MKVSVVAFVVVLVAALVWLWATTPPWSKTYCKEVPDVCKEVHGG